MGFIKKLGAAARVYVSYTQVAAAGTAPSAFIFSNPLGSGETYEIVGVTTIYDVVGGAVAVANVKVVPAATALASGTTALATTFDLTATARTQQRRTQASGLSATKTARLVKAGQSVAVETSGTLTGLTGLLVQVELMPLLRKTGR